MRIEDIVNQYVGHVQFTQNLEAKTALKICASRKIKLTRTVYSARSPADRLSSMYVYHLNNIIEIVFHGPR